MRPTIRFPIPTRFPTNNDDDYLDHLKPAYAGWRREARSHPQYANLSKADLSGTSLSGASLEFADLSDADLSHADLNNAILYSGDLSRANLSGTNLSGATLYGATLNNASLFTADLSGAKLDGAELRNANLSNADLSNAHLSGADLRNANLYAANLTRAELRNANLSAATLSSANLSRARLNGANLSGANLSGEVIIIDLLQVKVTDIIQENGANLSGADLRGAQVSKAKLAYVDLTDAYYAPVSEPTDTYVAGIKGLETLQVDPGEEIGLVQLRKLLQDAGLHDNEREATYSIQRSVTAGRFTSPFWRFSWVEGVGRFVGFDVTTAYGLHPTHALGWILLLGTVLTPVYMQAMLHPTRTSGIVRVLPKDRLDGTSGSPADEEKRKKIIIRSEAWRGAMTSAAYFSLISAANIGFDQFNPGDWIRRLQDREYSLEAVGWVRVVAGAQALLSLYLLAIWALTQFGRPFD